MTDDPAIAALAARLGADAYARRRRAEEACKPLRRRSSSLYLHVVKAVLSSDVVRFCFRASGLHRHGYRQFLDVKVVDHEVRLPRLPPALDGTVILHLSDLHLDLDPSFVPALAARLDGLAYDVAVISGDFRNLTLGPWEPSVAGTIRLLGQLRPPVYAVLGNHDALAMAPPLEAAGLRFLLNEHVVWSRGGADLVLAGVDDPRHFGSHDVGRALAGAPADAVRVLLAHSPIVHAEAEAAGVDLLLAGHTHGGQICLPGGRIVVSSERSPRAYRRGAWQHGRLQGYTSSGTGACGAPLRFHCPAEITRHILRRG